MEAYRVRHKTSGDFYHVLAGSAPDAVEIVTLTLAEADGAKAWEATPDTPAYPLHRGVVFDASGQPVTSLEA